jgi:hypothetical protein
VAIGDTTTYATGTARPEPLDTTHQIPVTEAAPVRRRRRHPDPAIRFWVGVATGWSLTVGAVCIAWITR